MSTILHRKWMFKSHILKIHSNNTSYFTLHLFSEEKPADLDKSQYSMEDQEMYSEFVFCFVTYFLNQIYLNNANFTFRKQEPVEQYSYTMGEAVKTADFWIISLIIFLNSIPITLQASTYKV